ncbi:transposase, MuDR, MULE transposase domain protein [Tanacetum coccineum]
MFVPFPPYAPTLITQSKNRVKFTKHFTFDDKEVCIYAIALKCLREGYQCKVLNSSTERDVKRVYTPKDIAHDVNLEWNVYVSYKKAWTGKQLALASTQGCPIESFAQLPFYCHNLKRENEGTVTYIDTDDEGRFKMCFIGFGVAIKSFLCYMRPFIIIDAAHLNGSYLGTNLVAIGMDGNNQIIPIATGMSQGETGESWTWFLRKLKECIGLFFPVTDVSTWEIPNEIQQVLPPDMGKKQSGRPKNRDRIRSQGEGPIINKCGRCGVKGHNRTACTIPLPKLQNMVKKKQKSTQQAKSSQGNNYWSETHQDVNQNFYEQSQMYEPQHVTNSTEDMYHPHQEYTHQYFMYQHNTESANMHINDLSQWLTPNNFLN